MSPASQHRSALLRSARGGPDAALLLLLAMVPLWMSTTNATTFAVHVGSSTVDAMPTGSGDEAVTAALGSASPTTARPEPAVPGSGHDRHLLHLVGACLAMLAAAAALLLPWHRGSGPDRLLPPSHAATDRGGGSHQRWPPRSLSPPRSSPVIRT